MSDKFSDNLYEFLSLAFSASSTTAPTKYAAVIVDLRGGLAHLNNNNVAGGWNWIGTGFLEPNYPVLWRNGAPDVFPPLSGYRGGSIGALGPNGEFVINCDHTDRRSVTPVLIKNGESTVLTGNGGNVTQAFACNDKTVVGMSITASRVASPVRWDDGKLTVLGGDKVGGRAMSINANGKVVGQNRASSNPRTTQFTAFAHTFEGGYVELGRFNPNDMTSAYDVNDKGVVVGNCQPKGGMRIPVKWDADNNIVNILPQGALGGMACSINNLGSIVGNMVANNTMSAWVDHGDEAKNLNDLVVNNDPSWTLYDAVAINDNGWIICMGTSSKTGERKSFVLMPVE